MSWHIMYFSGMKVRFDDFREESRILDTSEMATTSPFKTLSSMSNEHINKLFPPYAKILVHKRFKRFCLVS